MRVFLLNDYSEDSKHLAIEGAIVSNGETSFDDIEAIIEQVKANWSGEDYLINDIIKALPKDCEYIDDTLFVVDY